MRSLLKNHQHHSGVFFLYDYDSKNNNKFYIKSSSNIDGISDIRKELTGINWYNYHSKYQIKYQVTADNSQYINVKHALIEGVIPKFERKTYRSNLTYINTVINHYCELWSGLNNDMHAPLHGDLSLLGNIIFIEGKYPVLIDWEHFAIEGPPVGFDALYFLFELLWYELSTLNQIHHSVLSHIAEMMLLLKKCGCLSEYYFTSPLKTINDYMIQNKNLWGLQYKKMPNLLYNDSQVKFIDGCLSL